MKTVACTILLSLAVATSAFAQRTTLSATHWLAVQPGQDASAIIRQAQTTLDLTGHAVVVMLASGAHGTIGVDGSLWVGGNALMLVGQPGTTLTGLVASNGGRVQVSGVAFAACPGACIAAVGPATSTPRRSMSTEASCERGHTAVSRHRARRRRQHGDHPARIRTV